MSNLPETLPFEKSVINITSIDTMNNNNNRMKFASSEAPQKISSTLDIPTVNNFRNLSDYESQIIISVIITGAVLFAVITLQFIRQIPIILRTTPPKFLARTFVLNGVYCIVGAAALTSLCVFKAYVFCDSICHFAFVICAYQFFCLCVEYAGGETNFIKRTGGLLSFNVQTPPLCCCLTFLEPSPMTKRKFRITRAMVLQMPIIQGLILAALNVINIVDVKLYNSVLNYFVPFIVASILTGVWALQINSRMIAPYLPEHKIMIKYFCIQLVLIFCKLQPVIIQFICFAINSINSYKITTRIIENSFIQLLILLEMVFLSLVASRVYKLPIKGTEY